MKAKAYNPLQLDVAALAQDGASLNGTWPLGSLERLASSAHPDARPAADEALPWSVRGERRGVTGAAPEHWLHLRAGAVLRLQCQRCLEPLAVTVEVDRALRFVSGEQQAAALDAEGEDDVLELQRALDLRELVEDELLLALPLVPRHERCPQPLPFSAAAPAAAADNPHDNPFAVLESLKSPKAGH